MEQSGPGGARVASINRWKRSGHDRLYVNASDGRPIGWLDLSTGECRIERPALLPAFEKAIARWKETQSATAPIVDIGQRRIDTPARVGASVPVDAVRMDMADALTPRIPSPPPLSVVPGMAEAGGELHDSAPDAATVATCPAPEPARSWLDRLFGVATSETRLDSDGGLESVLAQELDKLGTGWHALQVVPTGHRSGIDHIVIGPPGVFTITTKRHAGSKVWVAGDTILVNGHRKSYARHSRHEAERVGAALSAAAGFAVSVTGMVVFVDAAGFTVKDQPQGVHVVNRPATLVWLRSLPRRLSAGEVESVFKVARRSSTWRRGERS